MTQETESAQKPQSGVLGEEQLSQGREQSIEVNKIK